MARAQRHTHKDQAQSSRLGCACTGYTSKHQGKASTSAQCCVRTKCPMTAVVCGTPGSVGHPRLHRGGGGRGARSARECVKGKASKAGSARLLVFRHHHPRPRNACGLFEVHAEMITLLKRRTALDHLARRLGTGGAGCVTVRARAHSCVCFPCAHLSSSCCRFRAVPSRSSPARFLFLVAVRPHFYM
jgi:hypothetical protein